MKQYLNFSGRSGVIEYEIYDTGMFVTFQNATRKRYSRVPRQVTYEYTYYRDGMSNVEQMKQLAIAGQGLNGFINSNGIKGQKKETPPILTFSYTIILVYFFVYLQL